MADLMREGQGEVMELPELPMWRSFLTFRGCSKANFPSQKSYYIKHSVAGRRLSLRPPPATPADKYRPLHRS